MRFFPQLQSGALTCFPFDLERLRRTLRASEPNVPLRASDTRFHYATWNLTYQHISGEEFGELESFFRECEGRLQTFTFLDPSGNLLRQSEDLTDGIWVVDTGLSVTDTGEKTSGGATVFELSNQTQSDLSLRQVLGVPPQYQYCLSVWLQSSQPATTTLFHSSAGNSNESKNRPTSSWRRYRLSSNLPSGTEPYSCEAGLVCGPGALVRAAGFQFEPQPNPSAYQSTADSCGVHSNARFDQDSLAAVNEGPDSYSTEMRVIAPLFV